MRVKVIKLEQSGCVPCQMVSNYLEEYSIVYEQINVSERPDIATKYKVMSVPVTVLEDDNGNELTRSIGFKPNELEDIIKAYKGEK